MTATKVKLLKLLRKIERPFKRIHRPIIIRKLQNNNKLSTRQITSPDGPVVTLTTFDRRIDIVYLAIESIARGEVRPSRITLWLEHELAERSLPDSLIQLEKRGLEVKYTTDLGPHKKYYPEICSGRDTEKPFVTADDDTLYPKYWLKKLAKSYAAQPNAIHCFRAHEIKLTDEGKLAPYSNWKTCDSIEPSHKHFSTGCFGVLFPPTMRKKLRELGLEFVESCPRADDIWLNATAVKSNIPVKQIVSVPKHFYEIPTTRSSSLFSYNVRGGGNDEQLEKTYTKEILEKLRSSSLTYEQIKENQ